MRVCQVHLASVAFILSLLLPTAAAAMSEGESGVLSRRNHGQCASQLHLLEGRTGHDLTAACRAAAYDEAVCKKALAVLGGRSLSRDLIAPVCAVLREASFPQAGPVSYDGLYSVRRQAELRRSAPLRGGRSLVSLDSAVARKRGPSYLVKSQDAEGMELPPSYSGGNVVPIYSVDHTIARPPDADGNPYNQPEWAANAPAPSPTGGGVSENTTAAAGETTTGETTTASGLSPVDTTGVETTEASTTLAAETTGGVSTVPGETTEAVTTAAQTTETTTTGAATTAEVVAESTIAAETTEATTTGAASTAQLFGESTVAAETTEATTTGAATTAEVVAESTVAAETTEATTTGSATTAEVVAESTVAAETTEATTTGEATTAELAAESTDAAETTEAATTEVVVSAAAETTAASTTTSTI